MLKKWVIVLLLTVANGLFLVNSVQAVSIGNNEVNNCISIKGRGDICPDKFCDPITATCSNDGDRCFCKPRFFSYNSTNKKAQKCEIAFGSKFYYYYTANGADPTVLLTGGIWSRLSQNRQGIVFKKVANSKNTYRSQNFLTPLINQVPPEMDNMEGIETAEIELNIDIDKNSSIGKVKNQSFYLKKNGTINKCSVHYHLGFTRPNKSLDGLFFLRKQPAQNIDACQKPAVVLLNKMFNASSLSDNQLADSPIGATKNCFTYKTEGSRLNFNDGLFENSSQNYDLLLLASNLIIPQNEQRNVYLIKAKNYYLNHIFNGGEADRSAKLDKLEKKFNQQCRGGETDFGFCNDYKQTLVDELRNNPNKSFETILAELMSKNDSIDIEICEMINISYDKPRDKDTYVSSERPLGTIGIEDYLVKDEAERALDDYLQPGIIQICDNLNNPAKRKICKKNSLNCYRLNAEQTKPVVGCSNLTKDHALKNAQWLICPMVNTSINSNQSLFGSILELFRTPSNFLNKDQFKQTYNKFTFVANTFLVLIFLIIIFSQLTNFGLNNYQIKKSLPIFIVITIAINLSYLINQIIIDISNIAGAGIFNLFYSMANSISDMSLDIFIILAGAGALAVAAIIFAFPLVVISVIGLLAILFILILRKGLVVMFALLTPVALVSAILPGTRTIFSKWRSKYLNLLLLYPVASFTFGVGLLAQKIIYYIFADDNSFSLIKMTAFFMPGVALIAVPMILKTTVNSIAKINSPLNRATSLSKKGYSSTIPAKAHQINKRNRFKDAIFRSSPTTKKLLGSKAINKITYGTGNRALSDHDRREARFAKDYEQILNKDPVLLKAFLNEKGNRGALYNSLTTTQKNNYNKLVDYGATNNPNFYSAAIKSLIANKSVDDETLKLLVEGSKANNPLHQSNMFVAHKIASNSGLTGLASKIITSLDKNIPTVKSTIDTENKFKLANENELSTTSSYRIINQFINPNETNNLIAKIKDSKLEDNSTLNIIKEHLNQSNVEQNIDDTASEIQLQLIKNSKQINILKKADELLDKIKLENYNSKDLKNTITLINEKGQTEEVSIFAKVIELRLSEGLGKNPKQNAKQHYINVLAKKWNLFNPTIKKELEPLIIKFAGNNDIKASRVEDVFEALELNSLRIKI